jgi:glycosyltransferase involved in cell wall biosynthesis
MVLAQAAQKRGWSVSLVTGQGGSPTMEMNSKVILKRNNIHHVQTFFRSSDINFLREAVGIFQVIKSVFQIQPDVVHTASPKGNLYGGIAARLCKTPRLIVSISGMGSLFIGVPSLPKRIARSVYRHVFRWILSHPNCSIIVQNPDDANDLLYHKLVSEKQLVEVPGSGVDLALYTDILPESSFPVVLFPARILRDKGVYEFVDAARLLKNRGYSWRFVLCGASDYENPSSIPKPQIEAWVDEEVIQFDGYAEDMPQKYAECSIVCLPSYREGMPKALLEAAAAGRAVVTTDAPGCRHAIIPGVTGFLVPVGNALALADSLEILMRDDILRSQMGIEGRKLANSKFDVSSVADVTMNLYGKN